MWGEEIARFNRVWSILEEEGVCDGYGGIGWRWCLTNWLFLDCPPDVERFIRENANTDSQGLYQGRKPYPSA